MFRHSRRALLVSVAAVVLALATARVVAGDLASLHSQARDAGPPVHIVVATRNLLLGETVSEDDLDARRIHRSEMPPGALRVASEGIGRVVTVPVLEGIPVVQGNLVDRERTGIDGVVPPGMRAVQVVAEGSVLPRPGELVDVLVTFDPSRIGPDVEPTLTVASGALVIKGAGAARDDEENMTGGATGSVTVTVLVSIETAHRLAFAAANGVVTLAIAPPEDAASSRSGADLRE